MERRKSDRRKNVPGGSADTIMKGRSVMNIVVFGANGPTGQLLTKQALNWVSRREGLVALVV